MSSLDDQYAFTGAVKELFACASHANDKPASYFFGNTNFTQTTEELIVTFTCLRCGTTYTFKKLTERVLL